jgi:pyruvate/2-oxoacid:ferredoxin oxidoreductase alpha subunit
MGEVPLAFVDVQRLGPATGGEMTLAPGDVLFVRWGSSGGYPVIALAPSAVADGSALTRRAFELAERFRTPLFLLSDEELATTVQTVAVGTAGGAPAPPPRSSASISSPPTPCAPRPARTEPRREPSPPRSRRAWASCPHGSSPPSGTTHPAASRRPRSLAPSEPPRRA